MVHRTRRRPIHAVLLAGILAVAMILAACGQRAEPTPRDAGTQPAAQEPGTGDTPQDAVFPVTTQHKFGQTEIPAQPNRVVTIGFSEQDPVLTLGVKPVAVRDWFGDQPNAVWPWAQDELGDATPEVLRMPYGELDFETIAALRPDLIVATHSGITAEEYEKLSLIAPTLAQPDDYPDFGVPWQVQTLLIGQALGLEELAWERVDQVEAAIAAARDAHPEFEGATIAWASPAGDGQYWAVGPNTPPLRFLTALGFRMTDQLAEVVGALDSAAISAEQMHLLDADVLIFHVGSEAERASLKGDPMFQRLDAAVSGRIVWFVGDDDPVYGALSFSTVLSLPYAVEHLVPQLAAALDAGPAAGGESR